MKYLKKFEMNENNPDVGYYVAIKTVYNGGSIYEVFEECTNKIIKINKNNSDNIISYDFQLLNDKFETGMWFRYNDLDIWSKNKEDIDIYILSRKFNI